MGVVYFLLGLHSYCLIFFTFGWVLLGIQALEKGIKRCVTLGSFEHSFGDIQALVWVLSTLASVFDPEQVSYLTYESRIPVKHHRKLDVRHLEYLKTSPMRQYSIVNMFHT